MTAQAEDELSRAIIKLMLDEPFYAHFLGQVTRIISTDVPTAAVGLKDQNICLFINPDFFIESLKSPEERIAILKHEVLHLVFYHLYRFIGEKNSNNAYLNNLAADLVVNQYVDPWPLPEGAILLNTFPRLDLEPEEDLAYYYEKLIETKSCCDEKLESLDAELQGSSDSAQKEEIEKEIQDWQKMKDILEGSGNSTVWMDDHSKWSDDPLDEISRQQIDNVVTKTKNRMQPKDWNGAPGWLKDHIDGIEARRKPKVDWKRSLRIFACNASRTKIKGTMKRHSKRFGAPNPGVRIKRFQKLAIIVDTSGSMVSDDVVSSLFAEIHAIWKTGAQVHIIECDSKVQRTYDYNGITPQFVEGGGGNDCDPAFEYLWEYRKKGLIDGCLFLTDGWFDEPTIKPPCKLLWLITDYGTDEYTAFGSSIFLD